jgi:hypothetical protein
MTALRWPARRYALSAFTWLVLQNRTYLLLGTLELMAMVRTRVVRFARPSTLVRG